MSLPDNPPSPSGPPPRGPAPAGLPLSPGLPDRCREAWDPCDPWSSCRERLRCAGLGITAAGLRGRGACGSPVARLTPSPPSPRLAAPSPTAPLPRSCGDASRRRLSAAAGASGPGGLRPPGCRVRPQATGPCVTASWAGSPTPEQPASPSCSSALGSAPKVAARTSLPGGPPICPWAGSPSSAALAAGHRPSPPPPASPS
jgi:hypothetical protein